MNDGRQIDHGDVQEVIRQGLAVLLASREIRLVAEAATGNEAITLSERHRPDSLEQIRENTPATKVIMISAHDDPSYLARAVVLGAVDFLLKDVPGEAYVAAIHRAVAGGELAAADTLFSQIRALLHHTISDAGLVGGGSTPTPGEISLSHNKISGPLLDRIDLHIEVPAVAPLERNQDDQIERDRLSRTELLITAVRPPESWPGGHIDGIKRFNFLDSTPRKLEGASDF